jgi:ribonuclease D
MMLVKFQAKENGVRASVIATRKQIVNMVLEGKTALSNDWRGALVNQMFEDVLAGEKKIMVENGAVVVS